MQGVGRRVRGEHRSKAGNITCANCFFLGQNSKVVISNWEGNATDAGDEEEASIFDDAESLVQHSRPAALIS